MGDCGRGQVEMASFRVAEFSELIDWRPTLFQDPIIAQRACVLCGILYKKAIRLPCVHTLCTKCHAQCVDKGSACPVDQKPFCEDDVEHLELSLKYILKREAACWNASRGCGLIAPTASLLDHYKECEFGVVACCVCHSSVLRRDILEHFKSGCRIHKAACLPTNNPAAQDLEDVSRACLEMKKAIGNISEDLMSLQTSLNQCCEDVTEEGARFMCQWQLQASRLAEQFSDFGAICTTGFTEQLNVLQAAINDYKENVSKELFTQSNKLAVVSDMVCKSLPSNCRAKTVHWYIEHWADLKKQALERGLVALNGTKRTMYDYSVSQYVQLERVSSVVNFGCFMMIHPGEHDLELQWPFRNVYTVGVIHPKDESVAISFTVNAGRYDDRPYFQRPNQGTKQGFGRPRLSTVEELEGKGFVQNDALHVFLEIEP